MENTEKAMNRLAQRYFWAMICMSITAISMSVLLFLVSIERAEERRKVEELYNNAVRLENRLVEIRERISLLKEIGVIPEAEIINELIREWEEAKQEE